MGPALTRIRRDARVRADHRVRRRKHDGVCLLVRNTEFFEIDAVTDSVWLGCEQGASVGEIVESVAGRHALPLEEALAATIVTLERFRTLGLAGYDGPAPSPDTGRAS